MAVGSNYSSRQCGDAEMVHDSSVDDAPVVPWSQMLDEVSGCRSRSWRCSEGSWCIVWGQVAMIRFTTDLHLRQRREIAKVFLMEDFGGIVVSSLWIYDLRHMCFDG